MFIDTSGGGTRIALVHHAAVKPGSDAARDVGCNCPVQDNRNGVRAPYPPQGWLISITCPVHRLEGT